MKPCFFSVDVESHQKCLNRSGHVLKGGEGGALHFQVHFENLSVLCGDVR